MDREPEVDDDLELEPEGEFKLEPELLTTTTRRSGFLYLVKVGARCKTVAI